MTGMKSCNGLVGVLGDALRRQFLGMRGESAFLEWRGSIGCACRSEESGVSITASLLSTYLDAERLHRP